jgi:putative DNA primase/helicase
MEERGYRTIIHKSDLATLGFGRSQQRTPALHLPGWDVHGKRRAGQIRPDEPRLLGGKSLKYESPSGCPAYLDVHPRMRAALADPLIPIVLTEGIKKADSGTSRGLLVVAAQGVYNWRAKNPYGGLTALPDFEAIAWNNRRVFLCFDSDWATKRLVYLGLSRLKRLLESKEASVAVIYLPPGPNGQKVGMDDYLVAGHSVQELLELASAELKGFEGEDSRTDGRPTIYTNGK